MATEAQLRAKGKYFKKKLNAKEVLRLYQAGERNFQGVILRGQSFKGQDLSGADFSEADIRSTNFARAILVSTKFISVKFGLQKLWKILLTSLSLLLSAISGFLSIMLAVSTTGIFGNVLSYQTIGWTSVIVLSSFLIIVISKGIKFGLIAMVLLTSFLSLICSFFVIFLSNISTTLMETANIFAQVAMLATVAGLVAGLGAELVAVTVAMVGAVAGKWVVIVATAFAIITGVGAASLAVAKLAASLAAISMVAAGGYIGWLALKGDEQHSWIHSLSSDFAAIGGTSFHRANLTKANFAGAVLKNTDFRETNITHVRWLGAEMIDQVLPGNTYLKSNQIKLWLTGKEGDRNFDGQDLRGVYLRGTDLTNASFINTDLSEADLSETTLTGARIQDWNINSQTKLDDVTCDYVYMREGKKERRPSDPSRNFKPGEFSRLFQKALETVDLVFLDGIDWKAFLLSLKELQDEYGEENIGLQSIESKKGVFVSRVEVPPDANKADIEASFWDKYNPLLEAKDKEIKLLSQQTEFYSQQVEVIRQDNTKLLGIVETMAEKETIKVQQNIYAPVTGLAGNVEGNQNIFSSPSITETSQEIQNLLTALQSNGLTQEQAEEQVAQDLADAVENDATALGKLVNWGKSLGNKAAETSVSEVARRVIKLALNFAGVLIP